MKTKTIVTICLLFLVLGAKLLQAEALEFPGSVPVLLSNQSVRGDLSLTKAQCVTLDRIRMNYKSDVRALRSAVNTVEKKAFNQTLRKLNLQYNAIALKILTSHQRQRLDQIGHQTLDGLMLFLPRVQKKLQLTKKQLAALETFHREGEAFAKRVNFKFEEGKVGLHERLETLRAWRIKQARNILHILTRAQKDLLREMRGQKFQAA